MTAAPRIKSKGIACLLVILVFTLHGVAAACPTCSDSLAQSEAHASMVQGYFWSILFMMSMPFLVFFGLGGYFYYLVRQSQANRPPVDPADGAALPDYQSTAASAAGTPVRA